MLKEIPPSKLNFLGRVVLFIGVVAFIVTFAEALDVAYQWEHDVRQKMDLRLRLSCFDARTVAAQDLTQSCREAEVALRTNIWVATLHRAWFQMFTTTHINLVIATWIPSTWALAKFVLGVGTFFWSWNWVIAQITQGIFVAITWWSQRKFTSQTGHLARRQKNE